MFSDYVFKYCIYIDKYIDKKELDNVFYLTTNFIDTINDIYIYNVDDKDEINEILTNYLVTLVDDRNFYDRIKKYLLKKYQHQELDEVGGEILSKIIPTITTKEQAKNYIALLTKLKVEFYLENKKEEYLSYLKQIK